MLAEGGLQALRIDALSRRLGVTKGSFYHHFVDLADYRRAVLGHYEETCTARHIAASTLTAGQPAPARLRSLAESVIAEENAHRGLEVAVRGWAAQDDDARQTVSRVDAQRLGHLEDLLGDLTGPSQAAVWARAIYWVLVGAEHAVPPGSAVEVRAVWDAMLDELTAEARR